jgi:prevent-host-death family protein
MNSTTNVSFSISQLRQGARSIVASVVNTQTPAVIVQRSKPKAVLVDYDYFQAVEEAVIDRLDAQAAEKAKGEERIPLAAYINKRWGTAVI